MTKDEILEHLNTIHFDSKRHKNIKEAFKELITRDDYKDVLRGKNTNLQLAEEIKKIIDSYNKLRKLDFEEIFKIVKEQEEEEEISDITYEIIIVSEDGTSTIMFRDPETNEYKKMNELPSSTFIDNGSFFISNDIIFNILGEKILDHYSHYGKIFIKYIRGIYVICNQDGHPLCYITYNGKHIYHVDETTYSKNINKLFDNLNKSNRITDANIANIIRKKGQYNFLNEWEITDISDHYILVTKGKEQAYYDYDGNCILSTATTKYVSLGKIYNSDFNIIQVSSYDAGLKKKYGYYSLDEKREIAPSKHHTAYPWYSIGVLIGEYPIYVIKEENGYRIIEDRNENKKKKIEYFLKAFEYARTEEHTYLSNLQYALEQQEVCIVPRNVQKLSENLYCINNQYYIRKGDAFERIFKGNLNFEYYDKIGIAIFLDSDEIYGVTYDKGYVNLLEYLFSSTDSKTKGEPKSEILASLQDSSFNPLSIAGKSNTSTRLQDSSFNPLSIVGKSNIPSLESSKALELIQHDNKISEALTVLLNSGLVTKDQITALINRNDNNEEIASNEIHEESVLGKSLEEASHGEKMFITKILGVSNDGNILWVQLRNIGDAIIDRTTKKIIINEFYTINHLDEFGNFTVSINENGIAKEYLLNSKKGTLIGPKKHISYPRNGIYITYDDKCQAYDQNGNEVITGVDRISWTSKYFVNRDGLILKKEMKLRIDNLGYVYIIDTDGDKLIKLPKENLELLELLGDVQNTIKLNS